MEFESQLADLTKRLATTPLLSRSKASELHRASYTAAIPRILAGETPRQATGGLAILNQDEDAFRAELKSIDNDLGRQIGIVNDSLDLWFNQGSIPPPYYAWRIAIILGKAKRKTEEQAFLAAWCRHFGTVVGGRYEALAARARKMGAY